MALTTLVVYGLGRRIYGPAVGLAAAFLYALLGNSPHVEGPHLNTEHMMLPLLLLSMLAAVEAGRRRVGWLSVLAGVTASLAILTKPVALPAVLPIFAAATISDFRGWRPACASAAWFIGGALAPVAAFGLWFLVNDALDDLYRDVFTFNTSYVGSSYTDQWRASTGVRSNCGSADLHSPVRCFCAPERRAGISQGSPPVLGLGSRHRVGNQARVTLPSGALFHPGNAGGRHPGVSGVSSGLVRSSENERAHPDGRQTLAAAVTILAATWWHLNENLDFYFRKSARAEDSVRVCRTRARSVSDGRSQSRKYVNSITAQHEEILVWAGEAEVYFLADRKSVTRYIFAGNPFPEREVVVRRDFEAKRPRVVVTYNERAGILWEYPTRSLF